MYCYRSHTDTIKVMTQDKADVILARASVLLQVSY